MKTVMLYVNSSKNIDINNICKFILSKKHNIIIDEKSAYNIQGLEKLPHNKCLEICDFILVLGGDGTILRITQDAVKYNKPILAMNLGTVGFMSDLEASEIDYIDRVLNNEFTIENRMMLSAKIIRNNEMIYENTALNEFLVIKSDVNRVVKIDMLADMDMVLSFRGDGLIIATPTGSTAYSLSAGGPVIEPLAKNILATPVCPHSMQAKSYVFSDNRCITISSENNILLSSDGNEPVPFNAGDKLIIKKSDVCCRLIRVKGLNIYNLLRMKLKENYET